MVDELARLLTEQRKDDDTDHVDGEYICRYTASALNRTIPVDPTILDNGTGLVYDQYHGWVRDDA